jgi:type IV pilus assembly protein PilB
MKIPEKDKSGQNPVSKKNHYPLNQSNQSNQSDMGVILPILLQEGHLTQKQVDYALRVRSKLASPKPLLDVVKELNYITDEKVRETVRSHLVTIKIGDLLVELGIITQSDLVAGLRIQAEEKPKQKLGEVLVRHNFIEERKLIETLSLQLGFPFVEPEFMEIDQKLFGKAPANLYETCHFIPICWEDNKVLIAFADPLDKKDLIEASNIFREEMIPAIASKQSIRRAIKRMQPGAEAQILNKLEGGSLIEIVDSIINTAIEERNVSDIHLEPLSDRLRIRFRMDGVLIHYKDYPLEFVPALTSRIKIMCEADITERRRHQGGRILFKHPSGVLDLRVSFYVTVFGEKIVLRLLNRQAELLNIEEIGLSKRTLDRFRRNALDTPSGVTLVTGPTGSGKTSTVYSCVNYLNDPQTSIITAEEPVEYIIEGIAQCSINPKINLTFEETLRHIVRQDPDVILIGEIRDAYSAEVAVQAALTGHKVLTTFHTEDSIGGLIRLLNLEIDAFLISSTVVCVVAQRLLRKLCQNCKEPHAVTADELLRLGYSPNEIVQATFHKPRGCSHCRHTGYKGRVAVFELLFLNEAVRDGLIDRKTSHQIRKISMESTGLVTLLEDGILKAAKGITSVHEVLRCLPRLQSPRPLAEIRRLLGE